MPNAIQTVSFSPVPTSGTYTLTFEGQTTGAINFDDDAGTIQAALESLSVIGSGNVSVSGEADAGTITITFQGSLADTSLPLTMCDCGKLNAAGSIGSVGVTQAGTNATTATYYLVVANGPAGQNPQAPQFGESQWGDTTSGWSDDGGSAEALSPGVYGPYTYQTPGSGAPQPNLWNNWAMYLDDGSASFLESWDGTLSAQFTGGADAIAEVEQIPQPTASGGTFAITTAPSGNSTNPLPYNISMADLQTALNALPDISNAGGVVVSGSDAGPWIVTWNTAGPLMESPTLNTISQPDGGGLTEPVTATTNTTQAGELPSVVGSVLRSTMISCEKVCA